MDRFDRISEEVRKELSEIIRTEIKDPRLPDFVSVTAVKVTKDLKHCKVHVSVLGDAEQKKNAIIALVHASGFIRREIGHRVRLRNTPEMHFELDDSIEHGMKISKLINDTIRSDQEKAAAGRTDVGDGSASGTGDEDGTDES